MSMPTANLCLMKNPGSEYLEPEDQIMERLHTELEPACILSDGVGQLSVGKVLTESMCCHMVIVLL